MTEHPSVRVAREYLAAQPATEIMALRQKLRGDQSEMAKASLRALNGLLSNEKVEPLDLIALERTQLRVEFDRLKAALN